MPFTKKTEFGILFLTRIIWRIYFKRQPPKQLQNLERKTGLSEETENIFSRGDTE